jgi:hypothetical protein
MPSLKIPAPTGGLNLRTNQSALNLDEARVLTNFYVDSGAIKTRKGFERGSNVSLDTNLLQVFPLTAASGEQLVLALATTGVLYRVDDPEDSAAATNYGTIGTDPWNYTIFKNRTYLFNGVNTGRVNTISTYGDATYTHASITMADVVIANPYKSRMYLVENYTCNIYYGGVDSISGALTLYDIEGLITQGGYIMWCGSWSRDSGAGAQDYFLVITSEGEILAFQGSYPGGTDWSLAGRYYISPPINPRCVSAFGADIAILTYEGVALASEILQNRSSEISSDQVYTLSYKISPIIKYYSNLFSTLSGWQILHYLSESMLIVNIPISLTESIQLVLNTSTNSWSKFSGINALSLARVGRFCYFAHASKLNLCRFWKTNADDGDPIQSEFRQAFTDGGLGGGSKRVTMIQPYLFSSQDLTPEIGIDTNFSDTVYAGEAMLGDDTGSEWNVAQWNLSPWAGDATIKDYWIPVEGFGKVFGVKLKLLSTSEVIYNGSQVYVDFGQGL